MSVGALLKVGQRGLAADHHRAGVDLEHQVETLGFELFHTHKLDRAGVIDQPIDAAEVLGGPEHGGLYRHLVAYIQLQGQGLAAGLLDLGRHRMDGARQLGVGLGAFRRDDDIGAVARRAQGDLAADATAGAGDEQGFALQ
ncbi:hypothetical protein D3C85_1188860 [compost metagenome]